MDMRDSMIFTFHVPPLARGKVLKHETELLKTQTLGVDLFNIFRKIQNRAVVCTSNLGDGGNETIIKGLVCGHAYRKLIFHFLFKSEVSALLVNLLMIHN